MHSGLRLFILLLTAMLPTVVAAEIVVTHFEPIRDTQLIETESRLQSFEAAQRTVEPLALQFRALGQDFHLQLQHNDRLTTALPEQDTALGVTAYRGELAGKPDSWARIVMYDGMPRGVIWDGREFYALEAPGDSNLAEDAAVMFRLSEAHVVPGSMQCGSHDLAGRADQVVKNINTAARAALAAAPGAVAEITISAIADFDFTQARGSDAAAVAAITTRMNNVDGYFSEQIGVQLVLEDIETIADPAVPFSATLVPEDLLDELSDYRAQTPRHNARGLTHLFTGRNLEDSTVGIAWRGSLCSNQFGTGLTEGRFSALNDSLIAAHEIGHNFGAQHDGEAGTPCEDATGAFIMSASINGSDQFSACSIDIMQAEAQRAQCVTPLPTVDVGVRRLSSNNSVLVKAPAEFEYEVSSNGALEAANVNASFVLPTTLQLDGVANSSGTCTTGAGIVDCDLGTMAGLSSATITLSTTPIRVGTGTLTATVTTTDNDQRRTNDQEEFLFAVRPAVDLVVSTPAGADVTVNRSGTVSATVQNNADFDASNLVLDIALDLGLRPDSASWSIGSCTVTEQRVNCRASRLAANASSTLNISVTGETSGRRSVSISANASEAEALPADNQVSGNIQVVEREQRNESGGGSLLATLLLLSGVAMVGARRRRVIATS